MLKNKGDNTCVEFNPKKQLKDEQSFGVIRFGFIQFTIGCYWMDLVEVGENGFRTFFNYIIKGDFWVAIKKQLKCMMMDVAL